MATPPDEFSIIESFFAARTARGELTRIGIGDDAAVVRPPADSDIVIATDMLCEGTHFPHGLSAESLGHRSLAVNLSDLAAMASEPLWATLALCMPDVDRAWLEGFSNGFFELAEVTGTELIGGDTVRGPLAVSVTVVGRLRSGGGVPRGGTMPGQSIYVTGTLGDAAAGLTFVGADSRNPDQDYLARRFTHPAPRLAAGRALERVATAMIDLSDGVGQDLPRLLGTSGNGASVALDCLPISTALGTVHPDEATRFAVEGGDDYELCFSSAPLDADELQALSTKAGCTITRIGEVTADPSVVYRDAAGEIWVPGRGFEHFGGDVE